MGFSTSISETIILIAAVILASSFSAYAIYAGISLQSNIIQNLDTFKQNLHTRIDIGYATINETTSPSHFVIYVKNTGTLPLTDFPMIDLYVGEYGKAVLYPYSKGAIVGSGKFNLTDVDEDGIWEVGESAIIKAYPKQSPSAQIYEVKIVPYRGIPSSYLFPPSP